ncbi:MAG: UDP-2,3-diacylglucosamine diphosphatase [Burkholderiales bacterium]|nr:UDP-2,3-diacylglucosamine diphosphatase [Burkholderiales bacterium]
MKHIQHQQKAQPEAVALFVSDLHLSQDLPKTTQAFFDFLRLHAARTRQLYLLGDMFEYWAGDDDISTPYNRQVIDRLRAVSDQGVKLYWIAGNRDFLVAENFARATGAQILTDPATVQIHGKTIVLAHGDAQCTDDVDYMAFRAQVRQAAWQEKFLSMPLAQRKDIIDGLRTNSKIEQQQKMAAIMDVNQHAIAKLFRESGATSMIHGHTHRPATHQHDEGIRYVLPDWDCDSTQARGGWLALYDNGSIVRHRWDGEVIPG